MKKTSLSQKPLFLNNPSLEDPVKKQEHLNKVAEPTDQPVVKKRGRPKKEPLKTEPLKTEVMVPKKRGRPKKEVIPSYKSNVQNKTQPEKDSFLWKEFSTNIPEPLLPLEFLIVDNKGKELKFYGYRTLDNCTCTNEPYLLAHMRKKYNNLKYRVIEGCLDINKCPNCFPNCNTCKRSLR